VITVTNDVLKKLSLIGRDLDEYSLDTVKMFYEDGKRAGYSLSASAKSKISVGKFKGTESADQGKSANGSELCKKTGTQ
jgi:hypothetical protein